MPDNDCFSIKLDNRLRRFKLVFNIYRIFDNTKYKGKTIGYDSKNHLYQVEYGDGNKEEFYHNEINAHHKPSNDLTIKKTRNINKTRKAINKK